MLESMQVQAKPQFTRIDTVILRVRDVAAAARWYADVLGFGVLVADEAEKLVVLDGCTPPLTLWQLKPGESAPAEGTQRSHPIFASVDAHADAAALAMSGARVGPVEEGEGVRFFRFQDLDGNTLEACQVL